MILGACLFVSISVFRQHYILVFRYMTNTFCPDISMTQSGVNFLPIAARVLHAVDFSCVAAGC